MRMFFPCGLCCDSTVDLEAEQVYDTYTIIHVHVDTHVHIHIHILTYISKYISKINLNLIISLNVIIVA